MRKFGAALAVLGLLLIIVVGCGSPSPKGGIDLSTAQSKVTAGMTEAEVKSALGEPMATMTQTDDGIEKAQMLYQNSDGKARQIKVRLENGIVTKVDAE